MNSTCTLRYSAHIWNIPGTALSSAACLTMVPLILKKKFILWSTGDGWETPPARVCLQNGRVAVCAFLALSLSTFQSIFRGVGALSVIALKPTQPLVLFSCQQSQLTQDPDSHMFLSTSVRFFFFFAKAKLPHLFSNVRTSCITTANPSVCPWHFTAYLLCRESPKLISRHWQRNQVYSTQRRHILQCWSTKLLFYLPNYWILSYITRIVSHRSKTAYTKVTRQLYFLLNHLSFVCEKQRQPLTWQPMLSINCKYGFVTSMAAASCTDGSVNPPTTWRVFEPGWSSAHFGQLYFGIFLLQLAKCLKTDGEGNTEPVERSASSQRHLSRTGVEYGVWITKHLHSSVWKRTDVKWFYL